MTRVTGTWLTQPGTQAVMGLLEAGGHEAYVVGGCVRNALLNEPITDVDISTSAHPERVMDLAQQAGFKAVPTGIDHGTVTVVAHGEGYEVTSYRADVETDGRRAVVRFAETMIEDAVRRDFTMNAIYADLRGQVVDPLGGLPDLHARRLRFIQDANRRIREDYLRILRFFRFSAYYGDPEQGMEPEALAAIADNLEGLDTLSRERVGAEMIKMMAAQSPVMAVASMAQVGVLARIMPGANITALGPLLAVEEMLGLPISAVRRLAATGFYDGASLRLSKTQQTQLALYRDLVPGPKAAGDIAYRHGAAISWDVVALRCAVFETLPDPDIGAAIETGANATFPVKAKDLMPGVSGPALGQALKRLEERWIASDFSLDRETLLADLPKG